MAVAAVIVLATVNYYGITRTAALTKIIVAIVLATLALVVTASLSGTNATASVRSWDLLADGWYGVLQSAGLLFFAFAGYARIATMGEEVRDPERVIPGDLDGSHDRRMSIYLLVGASILVALGPRVGEPVLNPATRRSMGRMGRGPACRSGWVRPPPRSAPARVDRRSGQNNAGRWHVTMIFRVLASRA